MKNYDELDKYIQRHYEISIEKCMPKACRSIDSGDGTIQRKPLLKGKSASISDDLSAEKEESGEKLSCLNEAYFQTEKGFQ